MSAHVAVFLTLNANFSAFVTFLPSLSIPDNVPWSPCKNVTVTWSFPGFGFSGSVGTTVFPALAVNLKYPSLLTKAVDDFVTVLSFGVHVTGPLYPSLNVISCGNLSSGNTVSGLTYVFPVVFIVFTPVDAKNLTSILSLGRSSTLGELGSLGSTVTMCSHTYSH